MAEAQTTTTAPAPVSTTPPEGAFGGPAWGVLALLVLGAVALLLARRRPGRTRRLEIIESLNLGPRRSLCLARVDERLLVLGVSEAGVQLLDAKPLTQAEACAQPLPIQPPFEQLLVESTSEQELRASLKARLAGEGPT